MSKCLGLLLDVLWEILLNRPFRKPLQTMYFCFIEKFDKIIFMCSMSCVSAPSIIAWVKRSGKRNRMKLLRVLTFAQRVRKLWIWDTYIYIIFFFVLVAACSGYRSLSISTLADSSRYCCWTEFPKIVNMKRGWIQYGKRSILRIHFFSFFFIIPVYIRYNFHFEYASTIPIH